MSIILAHGSLGGILFGMGFVVAVIASGFVPRYFARRYERSGGIAAKTNAMTSARIVYFVCGILFVMLFASDILKILVHRGVEGIRSCFEELINAAIMLCPPLLLTRDAYRIVKRKSDDLASGKCRKCGYDLRGNMSGRCPECGTATTVN